jgi:hypothetical protein
MDILQQEIAAFQRRKGVEVSEARQRVALRLSCGIDLPDLAGADHGILVQALARITRAIRRERLKGLGRHWSYDLNRHIALKQACDEVRRSLGLPDDPRPADTCPGKNNGARRRRRETVS